MSETVLIFLIVAVAVVVILVLFRQQLSRFLFKANREGIEAELETREPTTGASSSPATAAGDRPSVVISGNKQIGSGNQIDVGRADVAVEDNLQLGKDQEIVVRDDKAPPVLP